MGVSFLFLSLALKTLPVGTAYAVWTGIGAVGTAALGIYLFGEPATAARVTATSRRNSALDRRASGVDGTDRRRHRRPEAGHLNACMTVMCVRMAPGAARAVKHPAFRSIPSPAG